MKRAKQILKIILIMLCLFFMGCAAKKELPDKKAFTDYEKWKKLAEHTLPFSPSPSTTKVKEGIPRKTKSEILEEIKGPMAAEKLSGAPVKQEKRLPRVPVSLQMHEVDVGVLFRTLAKAADVNIILNKSISGTASLNIKKVPWDQVFNGLLNAYGYTYVWMDDIIRVVSLDDIKAQALLKNARQEMELQQREHDLALMALSTEKESFEPLHTRTVHVDYADPKQLRDNLWQFLVNSKSGNAKNSRIELDRKQDASGEDNGVRGAILVDAHTNSLIIQATASDMVTLLELMAELDKPISQIRIEAFIVETTGETARELGMQWGGLGFTGNGNHNGWIGGPVGGWDSSLFTDSEDPEGGGIPIIHMPNVGSISNFPSSSGAGAAGWKGLNLSAMAQNVGQFMLYAQLTALQEQGKLNILSKPSITTLDNQKAVIESGREIPFVSTNDGENTVQFKKAVLKLETTPHVIDGENLKIKIVTNKDELDFSNSVDGNPVILTKYAETEVVLQDGQTTVIGGLGKQTRSYAQSGIPGVKDIPILGKAFQQENNQVQMEDILIFITPHILKQRPPATQTRISESPPANEAQEPMKPVEPEYGFSLQVGVFANKENADRLVATLTQKGYSPYIFEAENSRKELLYSVRVNDFMDLKAAFEDENRFRKTQSQPAIVTFYNTLETVPREIK